MTERETRRQSLTLLKIICVVFGVAIITVALMADRLGIGQPGNFGGGQLLLALIGLFVVLVGLLGQAITKVYRGLAIILLNTLVLLACVELGAIVIARSGILPSYREEVFATYQELPYYAAQDWTEAYWREATRAENYGYEPYVVWRHLPFEGETIHISGEGIRETPGSDCGRDAFEVFVFGGSTMWGWGSPDWGTITAYLQVGLEDGMDGPVCVINYGEDGFVSTQGVIELMRQLQLGNKPDLVIFYDGVNDVYAAYESGQPGVHATLVDVAAKFEEQEHPLVKWFKTSRQFTLFERLVDMVRSDRSEANAILRNDAGLEIDTDHLANSVTDTYLSNHKIVSALAQEYGFQYYFFWQPYLGIDEKPLTIEEQRLSSAMDPELISLAMAVYERIYVSAPDYVNLWHIAHVFEDQDEQIWIDTWGHVTPEGNRLVAQEMLTIIGDRLAEK